eukprot:scaffold26022_cov27-Prasinocladus_malaysianus.AAC.3
MQATQVTTRHTTTLPLPTLGAGPGPSGCWWLAPPGGVRPCLATSPSLGCHLSTLSGCFRCFRTTAVVDDGACTHQACTADAGRSAVISAANFQAGLVA